MEKYKFIIILCSTMLIIPIFTLAQDEMVLPLNQTKQDTLTKSKAIYNPWGIGSTDQTPGAISVINPDEFLDFYNFRNVSDALNVRTSGFISGTNLYGLGNAVVIIDGVPGSLASLNIEEIEQITVLRDINSAIFYGANAGRGIIQVTTKRGLTSKPSIKLMVEHGFEVPVSYPTFLGSADYMKLYNEARDNDGLATPYSDHEIEQVSNRNNMYRYPDANYYNNEFLNPNLDFSRFQLNFTGGTLNTKYFMNAGWERTGSLMKIGEKEQSNRFNVRSNIDLKVNDFISSSLDIAGSIQIANGPNGNFWNDASTLLPNKYPPLIDTSLVSNKEALSGAKIIDGKYIVGGTSVYNNNIYGNLYLSGYQRNIQSLMRFSPGIDLDLSGISEGLKLKTRVSFLYNTQYTESQDNTYAVYGSSWINGIDNNDTLTINKIGVDKMTGTQGISGTGKTVQVGYYGLLDYHRVFRQKHDVSAMLNTNFYSFQETDVLYNHKNIHSGSYLNYVFDNRLIANFSSALIYSPKLPKGNNLKLSPSLGLGWVISNEAFFKSNRIDYLKLRASTGIVHTDINLANYYLYERSLTTGNTIYWNDNSKNNETTLINTIENTSLGFERRVELNAGIEALLLKKTLWVQANYFRQRVTDQIMQRRSIVPDIYSGFLPYTNYGEELYKGVEVELQLRKKLNQNLNFDLGANITHLKSEVIQTDEIWEFDYQYRTGKRTDALFALEAAGLFKDAEDIANHDVQKTFGTVQPGDIKYVDQNDDNFIDENDLVMVGNSLPDLSLALNLRIGYRNFDFFALASGRFGDESYKNNSYYWVYGERKYSEVVTNRWTPSTASTATYPRLSSGTNSNNFRNSSFWIYDNSRITISQVQISYNLKKLATGFRMERIGIYMRASNVALFSPNRDIIRLNVGSSPQTASYSIGIKTIF